jgi:hypothetical protein
MDLLPENPVVHKSKFWRRKSYSAPAAAEKTKALLAAGE